LIYAEALASVVLAFFRTETTNVGLAALFAVLTWIEPLWLNESLLLYAYSIKSMVYIALLVLIAKFGVYFQQVTL